MKVFGGASFYEQNGNFIAAAVFVILAKQVTDVLDLIWINISKCSNDFSMKALKQSLKIWLTQLSLLILQFCMHVFTISNVSWEMFFFIVKR